MGRRVAFLGHSDLAEIAYLSLQEFPLEFVALYDIDTLGAAGAADGDAGPTGAESNADAHGKEPASHGPTHRFFGTPRRPLELLAVDPPDYDVLVYTRVEPPDTDPRLNAIEFVEIF